MQTLDGTGSALGSAGLGRATCSPDLKRSTCAVRYRKC